MRILDMIRLNFCIILPLWPCFLPSSAPREWLGSVLASVFQMTSLKVREEGRLGGAFGEASAFCSARDLRTLGPSPVSGSLLRGESPYPSSPDPPSPPTHVLSLLLSCYQINK